MASNHGTVAHLLPPSYKRMIADWLEEDCPSFDYGGFVVGEIEGEARLLGKSKGIIAGVPFFNEVFRQLDCTVEWHFTEGASITPIAHVATVFGPTRKILLGERVALNTLARCSGIATKTSSLLKLLRSHNYKGILAGTRKTTPGFRLVEKYGMLVGGADPHRHDLSSMTMLKDNHIWSCAARHMKLDTDASQSLSASEKAAVTAKSIGTAVAVAKSAGGFAVKVEVECQSLEEADAAVAAGADVVMLDNFSPEECRDACRRLKEQWKGRNREFLVEVSGGLTEANVGGYVGGLGEEGMEVDILEGRSLIEGIAINADQSIRYARAVKPNSLKSK